MGWVMLLVGVLVPLLVGWWLLGHTRADLPLSLIGLTSLPVLVWGGSLGAKIGPCEVGGCMSSSQHSHLVISLVALGILAVAFVLLSMSQLYLGGAVLAIAELVGAYSMLKTDNAAAVMLLIFALAAAGYLLVRTMAKRAASRVPDFPPSA